MAMRQRYNFQTGRYEYVDAGTGRPVMSSLSSGVVPTGSASWGGLIGNTAGTMVPRGTDFINSGWDKRPSQIAWLEQREKNLARSRARLDELGRKRQSVGLTASEEIEFQSLANKLNLMMDPTQRKTVSGSNRLISTTEEPESVVESQMRERQEDEEFFRNFAGRRDEILRGSPLAQEQRLQDLESEYQARAARQMSRQMTEAQTAATTEKARVSAETEGIRAEQIARKREADIARKEQLAGLTEEQRAAAEQISQMMMGVTDDTVLAQMNKLIGQLSKNVSPEAIIRQAEGLAAEARRKEQIKKEAVQQAQANRIEIQNLRAQAREDYANFQDAANQQAFAAQARADIVELINKERARIANMNGILDVLESIKEPNERQKDAISDYNAALSGAKRVVEIYMKILQEGGAAAGVEGLEGMGESAPSQRQPSDGVKILLSRPDPADLIPGQLYTYKGREARWTGRGWDFTGA